MASETSNLLRRLRKLADTAAAAILITLELKNFVVIREAVATKLPDEFSISGERNSRMSWSPGCAWGPRQFVPSLGPLGVLEIMVFSVACERRNAWGRVTGAFSS